MKILFASKLRRFVRIIIAMILTCALYGFMYHKAFLLMLFSTIFVMFTSTGSALFQGLLRFVLLIFLAVLGHVFFPHFLNFYNQTDAILLGSLVGILTNTLILPDKVDLVFRKAVIPFLEAARDYFSAIILYVLNNNSDHMHQMDQAKIQVESKLLFLPIWIYQPGFDLALQKGYRYYFMQLNHLTEILFAMHYLARFIYDKEWIKTIESSLLQCDQGVIEFVAAIMKLLDLEKLQEGVVDFEDDIRDIEMIFNKIAPVPLELLETYNDAKYLAEFVHNLRELRIVLIQLAKALR